MRHLALISDHASPIAAAGGTDSGGQNVYVAHVARQMAQRGWLVDVYTRREAHDAPLAFDWLPGVRVINVPAGPAESLEKERLLPYMDAFTAEVAARIVAEQLRYDVVHANFFMSGLVGLTLKERFGLPLVTTFHALGKVRRLHQGADDRFSDARFAIEQRLIDGSDALIAECPQDREDMITLYDADPRRIAIVPCGFDPQELTPQDAAEARRALRWGDDELTILQLGRLVPRKGIDNVIEALALLRDRHHVRARLRIVGGNSDRPDEGATPEIARLRELARARGIADSVYFAGRSDRARLGCYYAAADVFVSTPWYEPFGITPLEAMACARPVIGSAVGGIRHSVVDGRTGYLVPPRDPAALAERLAYLAARPTLRGQLGAAGWARVRRHFTWSMVADQLASVYRRVERDPLLAATSNG